MALMVHVAAADDVGSSARNLLSAPDFRLRVSAALALGKTRDERALAALIRALDDRHPAVRAAAAAGVESTGRVEALPALRRRAARERAPAVRSQLATSVATLEQRAQRTPGRASRVLVKVGQLQNRTAVRGAVLDDVFRGATRARAHALPGVEVLSESADAAEGEARHLPVLLLDGVVIRLSRGKQGDRVAVSAAVEYVFRKVPEHALRASFNGSATALAGTAGGAGRAHPAQLAQLEQQALQGAVESAMRAAPEVMHRALQSDDGR